MKVSLIRWPEMWQFSLFVGPFEFRMGSQQFAAWRHKGNNNFATLWNFCHA